MSENIIVSENTIVLKERIDQASIKLKENNVEGSKETGALIFLGNVHDAFPRLLVTDKALTSREIHLWQLIRVAVSNPLQPEMLPNQELLCEYLKCSRPIVSQSTTVLRALRWLTLCNQVRGNNGQFVGNIYTLHDEPLCLADTMYLDQDYLDFIQDCKKSKTPRLNEIGNLIDSDIAAQIDAGINIGESPSQIQQSMRRLNSYKDIQKNSSKFATRTTEGDHVKNLNTVENNTSTHVKNFNTVKNGKLNTDQGLAANHVKKSKNDKKPKSNAVFNHVKNLNTAEFQKLYTAGALTRGSNVSNVSKKTYITEDLEKNSCDDNHGFENLKFPTLLSEGQNKAICRMVTRLSEDDHQYMLDYLDNRLKAAKAGRDEPVRNLFAYFGSICKKQKDGTLEPYDYVVPEKEMQLAKTSVKKQGMQGMSAEEIKKESDRRWEKEMREKHGIDPKTGLKFENEEA